MENRISQRNRDFAPIHTKEKNVILEFSIGVMKTLYANQSIHATAEQIDELVAARDELRKCENPIMNYGATAVYKEFDRPNHLDLILELNNLIIELKLRNLDRGTREITMAEIEHIRDLTFKLDRCRKRVVFY